MKPENLRLPKRGDEWHLLFTKKKERGLLFEAE
jgi:hypothetical protein